MPRSAAFAVSLAILFAWEPTDARKVEDRFAGQIIILRRQPPPRFRSQSAFVRFLRQQRTKRLKPVKPGADHWRIEFMAFFRRPIADSEVKVRFYDVTRGKRFVAADSVYTSARGQRILSSSFTLEKPKFQVGRKYLMYILNARNISLATAHFELDGKRETYSGRVEFTDEEVAR